MLLVLRRRRHRQWLSTNNQTLEFLSACPPADWLSRQKTTTAKPTEKERGSPRAANTMGLDWPAEADCSPLELAVYGCTTSHTGRRPGPGEGISVFFSLAALLRAIYQAD